MSLTEIFRIILLVLLLGCVAGVNLSRSLLQSVLVFWQAIRLLRLMILPLLVRYVPMQRPCIV